MRVCQFRHDGNSDPVTETLASHLSGENHNNILQAHRWLSNLRSGFGLQLQGLNPKYTT